MCCWISSSVIFLVAFFMDKYPTEMLVWTTVVVMPINSVVNPIVLLVIIQKWSGTKSVTCHGLLHVHFKINMILCLVYDWIENKNQISKDSCGLQNNHHKLTAICVSNDLVPLVCVCVCVCVFSFLHTARHSNTGHHRNVCVACVCVCGIHIVDELQRVTPQQGQFVLAQFIFKY